MSENYSYDHEQPEIYQTEPENAPNYSPNNPPWGSVSATLVWIVSVLLILLFPVMFLVPYLLSTGVNLADGDQMRNAILTDSNAILTQVLAVIPAHILTAVICFFVITRNRSENFFSMLGWRWNNVAWWHLLIILGVFFALSGVVMQFFPDNETELTRLLKSSDTAAVLVAFIAVISAPFVEEVVYRGVLYSAFQRRMGVPAAIVLTTALFSLVHVPQYYENLGTVFLLTVLSLLLTGLRAYSNNLLPSFVLHLLFNFLQSIVILSGVFWKE